MTNLSVHLVEAQYLFVPTLTDVFGELNWEVRSIATDLDIERLLADQPDVVFIDVDFISDEPLRVVRAARVLAPQSVICVYGSAGHLDLAQAYLGAGATQVFDKNADRGEILEGLRRAAARR